MRCRDERLARLYRRSGIFDERYCEELPLPSMDVRYQHHLAQCEKLFSAQQQRS
ncbi:MAG: hypothetical protein ACLVJ6_08815 [Merdibacter sp.]